MRFSVSSAATKSTLTVRQALGGLRNDLRDQLRRSATLLCGLELGAASWLGSASDFESIAHANLRQNILRMSRIRLEPAPELLDRNPQVL
jgi:hypothetical protein